MVGAQSTEVQKNSGPIPTGETCCPFMITPMVTMKLVSEKLVSEKPASERATRTGWTGLVACLVQLTANGMLEFADKPERLERSIGEMITTTATIRS